MVLLATWLIGMAGVPDYVLVWPHAVMVWVLTIGLFCSIGALVWAREDGQTPSRRMRVRLDGLQPADDQLPSAA